MKLTISGHGVAVGDGLRQHIERRVRFGIGRFGTRIARVSVRLTDVNGPRGGEDKLCRIEARLAGQPPVAVEESGADVVATFGRAIERTGRAVERAVARRFAQRRAIALRPGDLEATS